MMGACRLWFIRVSSQCRFICLHKLASMHTSEQDWEFFDMFV